MVADGLEHRHSGLIGSHFLAYDRQEVVGIAPDILPKGLTLRVSEDEVTLQGQGLSAKHLKAAFLTRGVLRSLLDVSLDAKDEGTLHFDRSQLPTGVCDLIVYDEAGNVLADRLFFVNHHDYDQRRITIEGAKTKYQPCEKADLTLAAPRDVRTLSVAVRDQKGTAPSYDSGFWVGFDLGYTIGHDDGKRGAR